MCIYVGLPEFFVLSVVLSEVIADTEPTAVDVTSIKGKN